VQKKKKKKKKIVKIALNFKIYLRIANVKIIATVATYKAM
jgi:hypothetical protein